MMFTLYHQPSPLWLHPGITSTILGKVHAWSIHGGEHWPGTTATKHPPGAVLVFIYYWHSCVISVGLCVLQNTGPASLNSTDRACMGFLRVSLRWALSETERGLSLDVHWYQAKYMTSVKK